MLQLGRNKNGNELHMNKHYFGVSLKNVNNRKLMKKKYLLKYNHTQKKNILLVSN